MAQQNPFDFIRDHLNLGSAGVMLEIWGDQAAFNPRQPDRIEVRLSRKGLARPLCQNDVARLLLLAMGIE